MVKKGNHEELWKGLINQDEQAVRIIMPKLIELVKGNMDRLTRMTGCRCNKEEALVFFIREQLVVFREKLIHDPLSRSADILHSIGNQCNGNLLLYESLVITADEEFIGILKQNAREELKPIFLLLLEENQGQVQEAMLNRFIDLQFKKFKYDLRNEPDNYFDLSELRFIRFARKNLLDCYEINDHVTKKVKKFIYSQFHHSHWYKREPQRFQLILEDLEAQCLEAFYIGLSKRDIENPYGFLMTICKHKVIDHFNKHQSGSASHAKIASDSGEETSPHINHGGGPVLVFMDHGKIPETPTPDTIISSLNLKNIATRLENDCPNKKHLQLLRLQIEGQKYEEISAITGYTADSAKQIVSNIKKKIRIAVGHDYLS